MTALDRAHGIAASPPLARKQQTLDSQARNFMTSFRMLIAACCITALAWNAPRAAAQTDSAAIQQQLTAQYALTKMTADGTDIVTAGAVLVLQKDGLLMCKSDLPLPTANAYKNGTVGPSGLLGMLGKLGAHSPGGGAANNREFVAGEKFWVTKIDTQSDGVVFTVLSDPIQDIRYRATLKFPFAKGAAVTPDQVLATVAEVVKVDGGGDGGQQTAQQQQEPQQAAPAETKTIALGQTKDQVMSIFGQPTKVVQLGPKEIDYYPDMKVTFVQNKVADVQ
jgi:hypothetical protein